MAINFNTLPKSTEGANSIYSAIDKPVLSTQYGLLYQMDCMNLFAMIKDDVIDCIIADPPFNLGKDYGNGKNHDALDTNDYLKWSYSWLNECIRVLRLGKVETRVETRDGRN